MLKILLLSKLRSHCATTSTTSGIANAPAAPSQIPKPSQPTAQEILHLHRVRNNKTSQEVSLEMEVDQYLSDPNQGTGILEYWQVRL
jgi:hypothetical protein